MRSDSLDFTAVVRTVAQEARQMGLVVPAFRSPPGLAGADRTIRRRDADLVVSVRLRGRPFGDIVADVIEGVIVANSITPRQDLPVRRRLLRAVEREICHAA